MAIKLRVMAPYPCWVRFESGQGVMYVRHTELTALGLAVAEAKRQCLEKLGPGKYHEVYEAGLIFESPPCQNFATPTEREALPVDWRGLHIPF